MSVAWHGEEERWSGRPDLAPSSAPLPETEAIIINFPRQLHTETPSTPEEDMNTFRNFVAGLGRGSVQEEAANNYFALMVELFLDPPTKEEDKESHFQLWRESFPDKAPGPDHSGSTTVIYNPVHTDAEFRELKLIRHIAERKSDPRDAYSYKDAYSQVVEMSAKATGAIGKLGPGYRGSTMKTLIDVYKEERRHSKLRVKAL